MLLFVKVHLKNIAPSYLWLPPMVDIVCDVLGSSCIIFLLLFVRASAKVTCHYSFDLFKRDKMAAPTEEMAKMDIKEEATEQKKVKGSKKSKKSAKSQGGSSNHILEVMNIFYN